MSAVWSGADSYQEVGEEEAHSGRFMVYGGGGGSVYLESFVAAAVFDLSQIDHQWDLGYMDCACTCRLIVHLFKKK